jgi:protein phosphatase PTC7
LAFVHTSSPSTASLSSSTLSTASCLSRSNRNLHPRYHSKDTIVTTVPRARRTLLLAMPEPLGNEGDWTAYLDEETTGLVYYFNSQTGESRWEPPTTSFPVISLTLEARRKAEAKQQEYLQVQQSQQQLQLQQQSQSNVQTFSEIGESNVRTTVRLAEKEKSVSAVDDSNNWYDSKSTTTTTTTAPEKSTITPTKKVAAKKKDESPNWFDSLFATTMSTKESKNNAAMTTEPIVDESPAVAEPEVKPAPVKKQPFPMFNSLFNRDRTKNGYLDTITSDEDAIDGIYTTPEISKPIKLDMASFVLPHPAKITWGGEDAVFTQGRTFGVFDGVSGAEKAYGVPLYSKTMASELKRLVGNEGLSMQDMINCLTRAAITCDQDSTGATTAILASISDDGFLRTLNVGDSACLVIRNGAVVARSKEISHYFDCPYQLSVDSPDRPRDGTKMNIELMPGDLILLGSDGIFDNLSDADILAVLQDSPSKPSVMAKRVVEQSRKVSLNRKAVTPYSLAAQKKGDPDYESGVGGKVDDVSCVVVRYG